MRLFSDDAIYIRAEPRTIIRALTRLSDDASWWPRARAAGGYGWVRLRAPADALGKTTIAATIGPVREWEGFAWILTDGEVVGRAEWWLDEQDAGTIVHHLLDGQRGRRRRGLPARTAHRRYRWAVRRGMNALKDHLEHA